ncbi:MAG TPA: nitronate monooxygenase [Dermatophilaceae bacterium]
MRLPSSWAPRCLYSGGGDLCPSPAGAAGCALPPHDPHSRLQRTLCPRLANRFAREHDGQAPQAYPEVHHLTRPLRAAATQAGDLSVPNLWAGTGWRQLTAEPAATIVRRIAADARQADS